MLLLNPELKMADGKQDALGLLLRAAPIFPEASCKCLFLLRGLKLCQQQGVAYADLSRHRRPRPQAGTSSVNATRAAQYAGDLPILAAICSMLYFGSSKLSRARNPCASSNGCTSPRCRFSIYL